MPTTLRSREAHVVLLCEAVNLIKELMSVIKELWNETLLHNQS